MYQNTVYMITCSLTYHKDRLFSTLLSMLLVDIVEKISH